MPRSLLTVHRATQLRSVGSRLVRLASGGAWPYAELLIRIWIGRLFIGFGLQQLMHWGVTVRVAEQQNPLPFLQPLHAAQLSTAAYLAGGLLLAAGAMTRYVSLPLLLLAVIAQWRIEAFDTQLFWVALFSWFCIQGAGPISLDQRLRQGLSESALPLVPRLIGLSRWLRRAGTPALLLVLRLWLGAALGVAAAANAHRLAVTGALSQWLPLDVSTRLPVAAAVVGAFSLLLGAGLRPVALAMLAGLLAGSAVDPRLTDSIYLLMLLALLVVHGGGAWALDGLLDRWLLRRSREDPTQRDAPRVVIVGAGFGGLRCARALSGVRASVTLIDRNNFHLFQPLLYQVATAALSPGDIAVPTRPVFRGIPSTRLLLSTVTGVDTVRRVVATEHREIPYDYLVLATGATHSYFGKDHWAPYAPGLKRIEDALDIRRRLLIAFERAEDCTDAGERAALLTFVVVGGGPTGVELAGAIAEMARFGMRGDFRNIDTAQARVILVQSGGRLLPSFPERLSGIALRALARLGVEIRLGGRVSGVDAHGVDVDRDRINARTVLWAAGVAASPAARWLQAEADPAGRIIVGDDLGVCGLPDVFAVGDTAASNGWAGAPVPGLAPAAKQAGAYVARQIRARIEGRVRPRPFRYRHAGSLATIGRKSAVVQVGGLMLWGTPAWWLWGIIHVGFMLGIRNRASTLLNWFWSYLTFGGVRLITGEEPSRR